MRFNLTFVAMIVSLTLSFCMGDAFSQSDLRTQPSGNGTQGATPAPETEEAKAFRELQEQIRSNQQRIDYLYRTIPIGFPDRRKLHKDEIARLTELNGELKTEVFEKAKAAFSSSEQPSIQSVKILEKRLRACLNPKSSDQSFAPETALGLIAMMTEKFPEAPSLRQFEFVANYAVERFENAEKAIRKLEALTGTELTGPKKLLKDTMDKYQQELMIRRQEAGNDDLPVVLLRTSEGNIKVQLFENHAPNTVANFIHLVRDQKFYDGKIFHLVKPGEFAVTGSPNGDGMGDAGYRIACECYGEKIRSHFRGTLAMMAASKDRGGSQFFITQQPNPHTYDGKYTAFGRVIEGMDVVLKLHTIDRTAGVASASNASKIISAEVIKARAHSYLPEKIANGAGFPSFNTGSRQTGNDNEESTRAGNAFDSRYPASPANDTAEGGRPGERSATEDEGTRSENRFDSDPAGGDSLTEDVDAPGAFDLLLQGGESNQ